MRVLVTGGAGYIGSHTVKELLAGGHETVVFDDLSQGRREAVLGGELVVGDVLDRAALRRCLREHPVDAVMHFAGKIAVGESVERPLLYWRVNLAGGITLLGAAMEAGVEIFIFSSSAAVYGEPKEVPIPEEHPIGPQSPYGRTKAAFEGVLEDAAAARGGKLRFASLRYFNAAGADPEGRIGEAHDPETHLVPLVLRAALRGGEVKVFGNDYPTADGTCVRDYIHVDDLARAHIAALEALAEGKAPGGAYNLGNGTGFSVREVLRTAERVTGRAVRAVDAPRRAGDPAVLVAGSEKIRRELGWRPRHPDLGEIIETAWRWHRKEGEGEA